ncbi:MAG: FprA family A-type flavoprotein [Deltaproteobacteria bacterium]|nr:FprA family A-type flavoprotein [Deltaproteobacteria bacterium]
MPKALIIYASRGGETKNIGELTAEAIKLTDSDANIMNANFVKKEDMFEAYDAYVFGSATYNGEMMQSMKALLFRAEKANLYGKTGALFGAYGWSGKTSYRIFETMENIFDMHMVGSPLRLKSTAVSGDRDIVHAYGREIAEKLKN